MLEHVLLQITYVKKDINVNHPKMPNSDKRFKYHIAACVEIDGANYVVDPIYNHEREYSGLSKFEAWKNFQNPLDDIVLPKRNLDKNNKANKVYNTQWGAHLMAERKRYSAEEKSAIVLEILQDGKKVSDVAEEHGIHPNQIMLWKKQALENMAELFKTERKDITAKKEQREISELKSQIAHKDSVIAELADENMSLKKKSFGLRLTK